jgi:hypothetical protein
VALAWIAAIRSPLGISESPRTVGVELRDLSAEGTSVSSICAPDSTPSKREPPTEAEESTGTEIAIQAIRARAEARMAILLGFG